MEIVKYPAEILVTRALPKDKFTDDTQLAIRLTKEALAQEENALAVASQQIGIAERVFSYRDIDNPNKLITVCDPIIQEFSDEPWLFNEGCLSFPGVFFHITRPRKIKVTYWDGEDRFVEIEHKDLISRVFQHEIDHLDGILFYERLPKGVRKQFERKLNGKNYDV